VLNRIHKTDPDQGNLRPVFFVCDEYRAFATTGENDPSGDEKFFSLARQARCIPIVATQSISSLRSTLYGKAWRTLLQGLRTKIFLALSDDFSAHIAGELCGKAERLKPGYTLSEAGQDARVSMLTGRPAAHRTTVSAAKTYNLSFDYVFEPKAFAELQNAQAIVLPYEGFNPLPRARVTSQRRDSAHCARRDPLCCNKGRPVAWRQPCLLSSGDGHDRASAIRGIP
jgi:hypothetical protein